MARSKSKVKRAKTRPKAKTAKKAKATGRRRKPAAKTTGDMPADLERRLLALAVRMEKTLDAVLLQALCEFADAWEDHFRTVKALQEDDRVQLAVKVE
jgi:hypothetical protein